MPHATTRAVRPIPRIFHPLTHRIAHPQDDAPAPHPAGMTACSRRLSEERATPPECRPQPTSTYPIAPSLPATPPECRPQPTSTYPIAPSLTRHHRMTHARPRQTPQERNEQMYSQIPSATVIVKPLLAATSKCVPAGYVAASVPPSTTTVQLPAMISMRSAAAVPK